MNNAFFFWFLFSWRTAISKESVWVIQNTQSGLKNWRNQDSIKDAGYARNVMLFIAQKILNNVGM